MLIHKSIIKSKVINFKTNYLTSKKSNNSILGNNVYEITGDKLLIIYFNYLNLNT